MVKNKQNKKTTKQNKQNQNKQNPQIVLATSPIKRWSLILLHLNLGLSHFVDGLNVWKGALCNFQSYFPRRLAASAQISWNTATKGSHPFCQKSNNLETVILKREGGKRTDERGASQVPSASPASMSHSQLWDSWVNKAFWISP